MEAALMLGCQGVYSTIEVPGGDVEQTRCCRQLAWARTMVG